MLKFAIRLVALTVILEASALVFADEMIITTLVLVTIALTAASLVIRARQSVEYERIATVQRVLPVGELIRSGVPDSETYLSATHLRSSRNGRLTL